MSARQLIVLAIAAVAAIAALLLIRGFGGRTAEPTTADSASIAGEQILVAARDINQGAALTPSDLGVAVFPESTISPTFVRVSAQPSAQADYVGAVTRRAFAAGEPITTGSVVQPDGRGFMAAQLEPGYRAIAVEISPTTAVGGYLQPNDRVDVIVTHSVDVRSESGSGQQVRSEIVLEDVRVLALGDTTETQAEGDAPATVDASVAVLELSPEDARALAMAVELGDISLALRGVQVDTVAAQGASSRSRALAQQSGGVRVHAFGAVSGGSR